MARGAGRRAGTGFRAATQTGPAAGEQRGGELVAGEGGGLAVRVERGGQAVELPGVGAARVGADCPRRGQDPVDRLGDGDGTAPDRGHSHARPLSCYAASAMPLVMYRITCMSRAVTVNTDRPSSGGVTLRAEWPGTFSARWPVLRSDTVP